MTTKLQVDFVNDGEPFEAPKVPVKYQYSYMKLQKKYGVTDEERRSGEAELPPEAYFEFFEHGKEALLELLQKVDPDVTEEDIIDNLTYIELDSLLDELLRLGSKGSTTFRVGEDEDFLSDQKEEALNKG